MAMAKKPDAIQTKGGGLILAKECTAAGGTVSGATWLNLGHIDDGSGPSDKTPIEKKTDETGNVVKRLLGDREVVIEGNLMQSDADLLVFLTVTCRNKYYHIYRYEGEVNGFYQEFFFGICQITPQMDLKSGTKLTPLEIIGLKNEAAITFAILDHPAQAKTAAIVIVAAEAYYKIVETAVT